MLLFKYSSANGDRYGCIGIVISEKTFQQNWTEKKSKTSSILLRTYTGHTLEVKGSIEVNVKYQSQEKQLPLLVIAGEGPSLLGCDWLAHVKLDWSFLYNIQSESFEQFGAVVKNFEQLLKERKALFCKGLGTLDDYEATFQIDDTVRPKYCKARPVPYAMKLLVEAELERLCKEGIIEPV